MQIDRINNFNLIILCLKKYRPELFYTLPNGKEAIAPIKRKNLKSLIDKCIITNPYLAGESFLINKTFNISLIPDKNYEHYEIFQGLDIWVLCFRLYNDDVSIISVSEAVWINTL